MALPLLASGLIVGSNAVAGLYHVGKAQDNRRFWRDYYKNTGVRPKYPYRAGVYDYLYDYADLGMNAGFSYGMLKNLR